MTFRLALLASIVALLPGCDSGIDCPDLGSLSVTLHVLDAGTQEYVIPAEVRYTIDGVEQRPASRGDDDSHRLSSSKPGLLEVTVMAEGYETAQAEYDVDYQDGECSPNIEDTIELVAE